MHSRRFAGCYFQDMFKTVSSILVLFQSSFLSRFCVVQKLFVRIVIFIIIIIIILFMVSRANTMIGE